jgi:ribonuclease HII
MGNRNTRPRPNLIRETELFRTGLRHIAGIDEAGRGAWAGPVVAAAVILPLERFNLASCLEDVRDSKLMTPAQRSRCFIRIQEIAVSIGIGEASSDEIDRLGIIDATRTAMHRAVESLSIPPQHLLIDHIKLPALPIPQTSLSKGDRIVLSIAAASVIAKVFRDDIMKDFESAYPGYGFSHHKGYGTCEHRCSLSLNGPTIIHRKSFAPIACYNSCAA